MRQGEFVYVLGMMGWGRAQNGRVSVCMSPPPFWVFCLIFFLANFFVDSLVHKGSLVKGKGLFPCKNSLAVVGGESGSG